MLKTRYSIPNFVEELQKNGAHILAYWHYWKTSSGIKPNGSWQTIHRNRLTRLEPEQKQFILWTEKVLASRGKYPHLAPQRPPGLVRRWYRLTNLSLAVERGGDQEDSREQRMGESSLLGFSLV